MTSFELGLRLAFSVSGMSKLASAPAEELAAILQQDDTDRRLHGKPHAPARPDKDPKDPSDALTYSTAGPFAGDSLSLMGLNPYDTADFAY